MPKFRLKILVSAVRFCPSPPQNQAITTKSCNCLFLYYNNTTTFRSFRLKYYCNYSINLAWQTNCTVERFNRIYRESIRHLLFFRSTSDLKIDLEMEEYNHRRPHESLENLIPKEWQTQLLKK
jgi:putative transposase